jgi:hypothetical protein
VSNQPLDRTCVKCGLRPAASSRGKAVCSSCRYRPTRNDKRRGTTSERGYGREHVRLRAWWKVKVDRGSVSCARCGLPITPGTPWDLGHDDDDRSRYTGPEHARCNRATNETGRTTAQLAPVARAQSRAW